MLSPDHPLFSLLNNLLFPSVQADRTAPTAAWRARYRSFLSFLLFPIMSSSFWNGRTKPDVAHAHHDEHALSLLPQHERRKELRGDVGDGRGPINGRANGASFPGDRNNGSDSSGSGSGNGRADETKARPSTSKIKCLDGLRGIACFLVFNYHFLWPWTPAIMLGYGARPPKSPEPYTDWAQLPILCLLHRGRPMVAIFFAISGYVLCRHVQTAIHQRRLDDAYKNLGSAVFRRIFRLYIPCTMSMFAVAMLAQTGAFRTEKAIFKGPDSVWINGTVTTAFFRDRNGTTGGACPNNTLVVQGRVGVAAALGLQTPLSVNETIADDDHLCLNMTSKLLSPAGLYWHVDKPQAPRKNATAGHNATAAPTVFTDFAEYHHHDPLNPATNTGTGARDSGKSKDGSKGAASLHSGLGTTANGTNTTHPHFKWIQLGGSWEEHPVVHPHLPKALANFTIVYMEWANPFNFGHIHPRYDPHTWTIPKELRGSMVLYTFLLGTAGLKARWRLAAAVGLASYALIVGYWDMGVFVGGMVASEVDLLRGTDELGALSAADRAFASSLRDRGGGFLSGRKARALRWLVTFAALHLLSYPDAGAEFTPGFRFLASLAPRWYLPISKWMFYQALGALLLIPCVLRSPTLRALLEGATAQYLGRISFSFYLMHGPVLHALGFWLMPRLFEQFGRATGYVIGWFMLLSVALYVAGWFHRKVDTWSLGIGRRLERVFANSE